MAVRISISPGRRRQLGRGSGQSDEPSGPARRVEAAFGQAFGARRLWHIHPVLAPDRWSRSCLWFHVDRFDHDQTADENAETHGNHISISTPFIVEETESG